MRKDINENKEIRPGLEYEDYFRIESWNFILRWKAIDGFET